MSSNSIEILDGGRTLSLRFGNRAEEIVADTSEQATRALAQMLFDEVGEVDSMVPFELRVLLVDGEPCVELHYQGGTGGTAHAVYTYSSAAAREIFEAVKTSIPPPILQQYET